MAHYEWLGGSGSFSDPNHWQLDLSSHVTPAGPPGSSDDISLTLQFGTVGGYAISAGDLEIDVALRFFYPGSAPIELDMGNLTVAGTGGVFATGPAVLTASSIKVDGTTAVLTAGGQQFSGGAVATVTTGALTIGAGGTGELIEGFNQSIAAPASVTVTGTLSAGDLSGGKGTITLYDAGDSLTAQSSVLIGNGGTGIVQVATGATFDATGQPVRLGVAQNSSGKITVSGTLNTGEFDIGIAGAGDLEVTGGTVQSKSGFIGKLGTGNGIVNVSGAGSTWTSTDGIEIGVGGTGKLSIASGGEVTAAAVNIGDAGQGTLVLNGSTSALTGISGLFIRVGDNGGTGEFDIQNGQQFGTATNIDIAETGGSAGKLIVDNAGLGVVTANVGGDAAASGGTGSLTVRNDSRFLANGNVAVWSHGTILVDASSAIFMGALANSGVVQITNTSGVDIDGAVSGAGEIDLGGFGLIEFSGSVASGQQIKFQGAKARIKAGDVAHFNGLVSGFARSDIIDLSNIAYNTGSRVQLSGSTLIVTPTTGPAVQVNFDPASLPTGNFVLRKDTGDGGTDIVLSVAASDFTGAGTSDVLFRDDATGDTGFYQIVNGANTGWSAFGASSTSYGIVGTGDFYDTGTADILFRDNVTGDTGFYQISNGTNIGWHDIGASSTAYSVVGVGDFTGNGTDDILFRDNATGDTGFYQMSNGAYVGWHDIGASSPAYSVVGVGDFMGNGIDDILFRDATGDTGFYQISNGAYAGWVDIGASSTAYSVVGVGDFNGDGTSDVLYRDNANGDTGFYAIVNGVNTGWRDIGASSTAYSVVATGDYLGSGTADIMFRDSANGDTGFYAIVNGVNTGWHDVGVSSTTYHVAS